MSNNANNIVLVKLRIPKEVPLSFKERYPELKEFSNNQIMDKLIKDEYFKTKDYFDIKYYSENDIKELFFND
jgi:hypothetical protein